MSFVVRAEMSGRVASGLVGGVYVGDVWNGTAGE